MQIDHPQSVCAHSACNCPVENGREYCSDHCQRAAAQGGSVQSEMRSACACGHPECDQAA